LDPPPQATNSRARASRAERGRKYFFKGVSKHAVANYRADSLYFTFFRIPVPSY
jgi:hypothetical protein